jgi:hypothetical protein
MNLDILRKYLVATVLKLSGFRAWLANLVFKVVFKKIEKWFKELKTKKENEKEEQDNLNKYKDVVNDKTKTPDEVRDAGKDFLNS